MMKKHRLNKRRLVVRLVLVALLVGLGFWMYDIGKEYSVLFDNETAEIDGKEYPAVPYGSLVIDGDEQNAIEIWEEDRPLQKLTGVGHTLTVTTLDEDDDSVLGTVERTIDLDFDTKAMMISLPAIVGGAENVLIPNPTYTGEPEAIPEESTDEQSADVPAAF